jgi:hypothetical protein
VVEPDPKCRMVTPMAAELPLCDMGERMQGQQCGPRLSRNDALMISAWSYGHYKNAVRGHDAIGVAHFYRHLDLGWLARFYR